MRLTPVFLFLCVSLRRFGDRWVSAVQRGDDYGATVEGKKLSVLCTVQFTWGTGDVDDRLWRP